MRAAKAAVRLSVQVFQPEPDDVRRMEAKIQRIPAAQRVPQLEMVQHTHPAGCASAICCAATQHILMAGFGRYSIKIIILKLRRSRGDTELDFIHLHINK